MIFADYLISEIIPSETMIKVVREKIVIFEGKAGEIDYRWISSYDVLMIEPISLEQRTDKDTIMVYPNALKITVG